MKTVNEVVETGVTPLILLEVADETGFHNIVS